MTRSCAPVGDEGRDADYARSDRAKMKIARFRSNGNTEFGIVVHQEILVLAGNPIHEGVLLTGKRISLADATLLAPIEVPSKIICVGMNYASHRDEMKFDGPSHPLIFLKPSSAIVGPGEAILIPNVEGRIVHEGELAVVIGKVTKDVEIRDVADHIFGYTIANDVSARDQMFLDGQWARAKGYDTFCPVGPVIETSLSPANVHIETFVDGEPRRRGNTSEMLHDVPTLISYISEIFTLWPGDLVLTGTPAGAGAFEAGQTVDIRIEGIGMLSNPARSRGELLHIS